MEIRLVKGSAPAAVLERLQQQLRELDGVTNIFELPARPELFPRSLFTRQLAQLELWSHAVAVAVRDGAVEWVDAKNEISANVLRGGDRGFLPAYAHEPSTPHRRLDQYVSSLVGVESAQRQGILGNDIVVGVTDSGLYMYHDQFYQPSLSIFDAPDMKARKVVYYYAWANAYDEAEEVVCGHGTHVAGLLAGSSATTQPNIGIASAAKIAFMDIGRQSDACAGTRGCPVSLETPGEAAMLLKSQMKVGARIFSFSWGTPGSDYSSQARDLDDFIYQNPDVLIIVAAGNSGEKTATGQGTISSPSGAKNVISVGASLNAAESFSQTPCAAFNPLTVASFSSAGPTSDGRLKPGRRRTGHVARVEPVGGAALDDAHDRDVLATGHVAGDARGHGHGRAALRVAARRLVARGPQGRRVRHALDPGGAAQGADHPQQRLAAAAARADAHGPGVLRHARARRDRADVPGRVPGLRQAQTCPTSWTLRRTRRRRSSFCPTRPPAASRVWPRARSATQLQHDLDLSVRIRGTDKTFYPLTANPTTRRDDRNNVEMVQVSYQQLLDAMLKDTSNNSSTNGTSLVGPAGEIVVEAIVFGRSVQAADSQAFAFVASSNVIGTASGGAGASRGGAGDNGSGKNKGSGTGLFGGDPFWTPWTLAGVVVGALMLLCVLGGCVRWLHGASRPRARRRWWRSGVRRPPHTGVATAAE
ncbi:hypothetical protein PINS_up013062 [Pythium insidiosum]|nr:hypothetical protein PINS_up013062 [Pythium insidiosum]